METTKDILAQALEIGNPTVELEANRVAVHNSYTVVETPAAYKTVPPERTVLNQSIKNKNDFIEFVKEYAEEGTKLFYNDSKVEAVFNYSQKEKADFGDSKATLTLEYTSYYKTFANVASGRKLTQKEFVKVLKELEIAIVSHPAIEIVTLAQSLQSVQKVSSMMTNSSKAVTIDAEVRGGKNESITLPEKLTFKLPVYKNDLERLTEFEVEIFADFDNEFGINLVCYRLEEITEQTTREMLDDICKALDDVKAYQV